MDSYEVIITPRALYLLDGYISYIQNVLKNEQAAEAAEAVWQDAIETEIELETVAGSLAYCTHPKLQEYGYRLILFKKHHYLMLYRTEGRFAYVDAIYHQLQDYEGIFLREIDE